MVDSNAGAVGYTRLAASAWVDVEKPLGGGRVAPFLGNWTAGGNGEVNEHYLIVGVKDLREFNREGLK